jgi:long-chain acyl-CoA synthetase
MEQTPDLKFMGIFSENRMEWIMTELSCCGDSICLVPLAIENQFMNEDRISGVINKTQLLTLCVSKGTIGVILDLKSKDLLPHLKNLIIYDTPEDAHLTLATQVGFEIFSFVDLINEGHKMVD